MMRVVGMPAFTASSYEGGSSTCRIVSSASGRGRFSPLGGGRVASSISTTVGGRGSRRLFISRCTAWFAMSTTPLMPEASPSTTFCWKFWSLSFSLNNCPVLLFQALFP